MSDSSQEFVRTHRSDRIEISAAHIVSRMLTPGTAVERAVELFDAMSDQLRADRPKKERAAEAGGASKSGDARAPGKEPEGREKLPRMRPADLRQLVASILAGGLVGPETNVCEAASVCGQLEDELHASRQGVQLNTVPPPPSLQ